MTRIFTWQKSYQDAFLEMGPVEMRTKITRVSAELEQRTRELMFRRDAESALNCRRLQTPALEKTELTVPVEVVSHRGSIFA
jgi:hypothetical protein